MSDVRSFTSAPKAGERDMPYNIAMFGDFGTIIPFSLPVSNMILKDHQERPFNFSLLLGDIAYAGVNHYGELEPVWDVFGM